MWDVYDFLEHVVVSFMVQRWCR